MAHIVKLSALSAVCAPVIYIAHALVPVGCPHVRYTASAMVVRVHARWGIYST